VRLGRIDAAFAFAMGSAALVLPTTATAQSGPERLTLRQVLERTLDGSLEIRDAQLSLEVAEEQAQEAWSAVYPRVDLSASYARNLAAPVSFLPANIFDPTAPEGEFLAVQFGADNSWNTGITVEQPLFEASAFIGVGAAGRFRSLQEEVVRGRTQDAVTSARMEFYDLLLAQEERRLTGNSIARLEEALSENRALLEAGLVPEYDVLRLEVELANLRPDLRRSENAIEEKTRALGLRLGMGANASFEVSGSLAELDLTNVAANSPENRELLTLGGAMTPGADAEAVAVGQARTARSELRQLELTRSLRQTELRLEQVEYLPKVNLFGSYTIVAQQNGDPDFFGSGSSQRGYARQVGISVTMPIFTGLSRDSRIDQKRVVLEQAQTQLDLATETAENDVRSLLSRVAEALDRAAAQQLAVGQATRGFDIASAQYREGVGSQLERTDAEVALRQSEFNYAAAVYDYLVARAQLDRATGQVPLVDRPGSTVQGVGSK
jgi:outer membrane protein TolC